MVVTTDFPVKETGETNFPVGIIGHEVEPAVFPVRIPEKRFSGHVFPVKNYAITLVIAFGFVSVVGLFMALMWALFFHPTALMPMAMSMFGIFYVTTAIITKH
jgi:hypothetical protein